MQQSNATPKMMTIRQIAATGILPEHALRTLNRQGRLPKICVGKVTYVNYSKLCEMLNSIVITS